VRESDLRGILNVVGAAADGPVPEWGLPVPVLDQLASLVPCDMVTFCDFDVSARITYGCQDLAGNELTIFEESQGIDQDPFFDNYWESRSCSYPSRSGDQRSVTTRSDFYTRREWRNTRMYAEWFLGLDTPFENEMMCCIPTPGMRTRRILYFRLGGSDFDDRERMVLALLRPHLAEMHRDIERKRARVPELTPRQWELLRLVAAGQTNAEIAADLVLSAHTVRKHLENIFERLQVTSRAAAVMRAFPEGVAAD
jgi:DNA-binding CsgD family transcriptional regulator